MRAIVLLCLLHATFGQNKPYSWDGPGQGEPDPDQRAGSVCHTDQGSCGCCLMLREMNRLRTYFNTTLNTLEKEYLQTKQSLNNMEASRIAFSAALYSDDRFKCYGPFDVNSLIVYKHVFLNLGGGYNVQTGIFTVPRSGVYSLALTVFSDAGSPGNSLAACAGLQVNGQLVAGSRDQNKNDQEDSATIVVVLHLKAGNQVAVNLPIGCFLCDDNSHYNTFSAFLLYVTE
ncbi:complement C1q-like protein 4 [Siniperca chuatsi]|uniref:complement C1q-like protein 4 n=1 Tax=Siniperca chuatsi TaxID=119488 RepID=UPI001CE140D4|nr:complement C1q-like protein 4 [Siniperca chuatsi]